MNTVDQLLKHIVFVLPEDCEIPTRDVRILKSMNNAMTSLNYITENQSKLLVKIIVEHIDYLKTIVVNCDIDRILDLNLWGRSFRYVEPHRKIYIKNSEDPEIVVDFSFSTQIRSALQHHPVLRPVSIGKLYTCELTEQNVMLVIDALTPFNFELSTDLQTYYDIISKWDENEVKEQFALTSFTNKNFQKHITADLGAETSLDDLIVNDRRLRYQYTITNMIPTTSLTGMIANRTSTKIWVDNSQFSFIDVVSSLIMLKRFPLLLVFNSQTENLHKDLEEVRDAFKKLELTSDIGIYFRLSNNTSGKQFNDIIAEEQYNCILDTNTQVAGVAANKLPKFFLTTKWKPMSVISVNNSLRHSKTAIYANCCDLIISYTDSMPIIETRQLWQ